jgi:hypothetical protein
LHLLCERARGENSAYYPYMCMLPDQEGELTECSLKLTDFPLKLIECSLKLTECSLKLSECSLNLTFRAHSGNIQGTLWPPVGLLEGEVPALALQRFREMVVRCVRFKLTTSKPCVSCGELNNTITRKARRKHSAVNFFHRKIHHKRYPQNPGPPPKPWHATSHDYSIFLYEYIYLAFMNAHQAKTKCTVVSLQ